MGGQSALAEGNTLDWEDWATPGNNRFLLRLSVAPEGGLYHAHGGSGSQCSHRAEKPCGQARMLACPVCPAPTELSWGGLEGRWPPIYRSPLPDAPLSGVACVAARRDLAKRSLDPSLVNSPIKDQHR